MEKDTDLPGLESVEFRKDGNDSMDFFPLVVLVAAVCAVIVPVVLLTLMISDQGLQDYGTVALLLASFAGGIGLLRLHSTSSMFDNYWRTSSNGLTVARLFKRQFVHWHEVENAQTKWVNLLVGRVHVLQAGNTHILYTDRADVSGRFDQAAPAEAPKGRRDRASRSGGHALGSDFG